MPNPSDIDFDLSTIVLGTTRSPGVCTLSGHDRKEKWDIKDAKGQDGASTSLQGKPIGQFTASFYLVDDETPGAVNQFDAWDNFQKLVESTTNGAKPVALPIYHPDLARNGFTTVVKASISGMHYDGRGGATVVVEFIEFKPPKAKPAAKAQPKPSSSYASDPANDVQGTGVRAAPDPNEDAKNELNDLVNQASAP